MSRAGNILFTIMHCTIMHREIVRLEIWNFDWVLPYFATYEQGDRGSFTVVSGSHMMCRDRAYVFMLVWLLVSSSLQLPGAFQDVIAEENFDTAAQPSSCYYRLHRKTGCIC